VAGQAVPRSATARHSEPCNWDLGIGLKSCATVILPGPAPCTYSRGLPVLFLPAWGLVVPATRLSFPTVASQATTTVVSELDATAAPRGPPDRVGLPAASPAKSSLHRRNGKPGPA
jgi:hypothetical protein